MWLKNCHFLYILWKIWNKNAHYGQRLYHNSQNFLQNFCSWRFKNIEPIFLWIVKNMKNRLKSWKPKNNWGSLEIYWFLQKKVCTLYTDTSLSVYTIYYLVYHNLKSVYTIYGYTTIRIHYIRLPHYPYTVYTNTPLSVYSVYTDTPLSTHILYTNNLYLFFIYEPFPK